MLVADIEIWPFGDLDTRYSVQRVYVWNKASLGEGVSLYGSYIVEAKDDDNLATRNFLRQNPNTGVEFNHLRRDGAAVCIQKAVEAWESSAVEK